jgi:hypothetical protein
MSCQFSLGQMYHSRHLSSRRRHFRVLFLVGGGGTRNFAYRPLRPSLMVFVVEERIFSHITLIFGTEYFRRIFILRFPKCQRGVPGFSVPLLASMNTGLVHWAIYGLSTKRSRDSSVGIATGYGLDDREVGVRVPVGSGTFSSPRRPDQLCGPSPVGTWGSFPGVKRLRREANHSFPTSIEVKKTWIYTSTPTYIFVAWRLIN